MAVETLAWAHRTAGRLGSADRLRLMADAILAGINRRLRARRRPPFVPKAGSLRLPDTAPCVAAGELLIAVSEPWLVNHCLRTFLWASILGMRDGHTYDEELLCVGAALHDLGLTEAGAELATIPSHCFAVEGAFAASAFLARHGVTEERRERIAEAIALHLNVRVPLKQQSQERPHSRAAFLCRHGLITLIRRSPFAS